MERLITKKLIEWKESEYRKPLILRGARQVGKTYIVTKFAEEKYYNMAYFNFDNDEELKKVFEYTKEPERILDQLRIISGKEISKGKTLIFFDEVQECQNALNSLKYFNENANDYHIIAAGSLLGIKLAKSTFPVGKVEFLDLKPMTFSEFLIASNHQNFVEGMKKIENIEALHEKLVEQLKIYYVVGGMPEVVKIWTETKKIENVYKMQNNILNAYIEDFGKHTTAADRTKITRNISNNTFTIC